MALKLTRGSLRETSPRHRAAVAAVGAVAGLALGLGLGLTLATHDDNDSAATQDLGGQARLHGLLIDAVPGSEGQPVGMFEVVDADTGVRLPGSAVAYTTVDAAHAAAQAWADQHPEEDFQIVDPA